MSDIALKGMMLVVEDSDANIGTSDEADFEAAAQRFARSALNPLHDRVVARTAGFAVPAC